MGKLKPIAMSVKEFDKHIKALGKKKRKKKR